MNFSILDAFAIIGSLGLFIYGVKIAGESSQKALGNILTSVLNKMTRNRFSGILTGFLLTSVLFSSSSTIVMVVSFVNSGLITLTESASIMLGADIGTTMVTWLVSIVGFDSNMPYFYVLLLAVGTPLIFSSKNKLKYIGEFIFGIALLLLGLNLSLKFIPSSQEISSVVSFFDNLSSMGFVENIFFVLIGVILTIALQSSVAAIVFTQVLCFNSIIPFEVAIPMVLGQNFGRTINVELAAMSGNVYAKRTARLHSIVNIVGLLWMIIMLSIFPVLSWLEYIATHVFTIDTLLTPSKLPYGIAIFHTLYNLINTIVLVWFIPQLVKLATNNVKSKGESDEKYHLEHISTGILSTPDVSIFEAQKEIANFGQITLRMNGYVKTLILEQNSEKIIELLKKVKKYEDITDKIEIEVADYLTKVSQGELSEVLSLRIRGMLRIIVNLERVGDIYYQMSKTIERKHEHKVWFTPEQRKNILAMFAVVEDALNNMCLNLNSNYDSVSIGKARELEDAINNLRNILRKEHFKNVEKGEYDFKSATAYSELYNALEKIGDHIINVSEGVTGVQ